MNDKEKIVLTKVQETLLITLYAKAQANPILKDEKATQILDRVQYDFTRLKVPQKTAVTVWVRARQLDIYTSQFITDHPNAVILHLGCGLDSRVLRVQPPAARWIDLDMPDVIDLRRKFYAETDAYQMIASSVTDLAWMDQVSTHGQPTLVVAEGLMMYLGEEDVRHLILGLQDKFPGCELVFDAFSQLTADRVKAHPSVHKTGATVRWGIDDPHAIEAWGKGIHLKEEWFFSQFPGIDRLGWFYRMMFRLTASIQVVQRAQRLLYYTL